LGDPYGEKEPDTAPPVMAMLVMATAPVTMNGPGWVHMVGVPGGDVQVNLNLLGGVGVRAAPLKTVLHLLAPPVDMNLSFPLIFPSWGLPRDVTHGLVVVPNVAVMVKTSVGEIPPVLRCGENLMMPFHVRQATVPGRTGDFCAAPAPDPTTVKKMTGRVTTTMMDVIFLVM
jgi:hypothetical protein